jgi:hypothetical protein
MTKGTIVLKPAAALTARWSEVPDVALGGGAAHEYLLVEEDGAPKLRFDLCRASPEASHKTEGICWRDLIVIGFGERVFVVDPLSLESRCIQLNGYFSQFHCGDEWLLAASATDIVRLDRGGRMVWCSEALGIDGVIIQAVADGIISGEGEWDPPGGWIPFRISLRNGSSSPEQEP